MREADELEDEENPSRRDELGQPSSRLPPRA